MNAIAIVGLAAALGGLPPDKPATESSVSAAPLEASAYFHLGEHYEAQLFAYYYQIVGDKIGQRFDMIDSECRRLGASESVRENQTAYRKGRLSLTFLAKPVNTWNADEAKQWADAPKADETAWTAWLAQVEPDHSARFVWHLGRLSLFCWFFMGSDVLERNVALKAYERTIREQVRIAEALYTDPYYAKARERLSPKAAAALKAMADRTGPIEDPFGAGVTMDDLRILDESARTLRDLAKARALTTDEAPKATP